MFSLLNWPYPKLMQSKFLLGTLNKGRSTWTKAWENKRAKVSLRMSFLSPTKIPIIVDIYFCLLSWRGEKSSPKSPCVLPECWFTRRLHSGPCIWDHGFSDYLWWRTSLLHLPHPHPLWTGTCIKYSKNESLEKWHTNYDIQNISLSFYY